ETPSLLHRAGGHTLVLGLASEVLHATYEISASNLSKKTGFPVGVEAVWQMQFTGRTMIGVLANSNEARATRAASVRSINRINDDFVYWSQPEESGETEPDWSCGSSGIPSSSRPQWWSEWLGNAIGTPSYVSFHPQTLREDVLLSYAESPLQRNGFSLPAVLDSLLRTHRAVFEAIQDRFCEMFPRYKGLAVVSGAKKGSPWHRLNFLTQGDYDLPVEVVSDGVVLALAFLVLRHWPDPSRILLVEEPENGVHYSKLKDIVALLREMCEKQKVQIIVTTHSPYLLDLVEPEDVRVFSKDREGAVHAAKLSDFPEVEAMKKHFMSGEIWTTFDEAEIVEKARGSK
ncbi:MAG: AAA family ATPase, partial [Phycisphaerae bacterium]